MIKYTVERDRTMENETYILAVSEQLKTASDTFRRRIAMIARIWRGAVPASKGDAYLELMRNIALPDYRATPGNRGAWCLRRNAGELAHFEMLTLWEDVEAIKRFAGNDYELAKYYDFDADFLIEMDVHVEHFDAYSDPMIGA